jgi:Sec-independent protein translocase protein TatA
MEGWVQHGGVEKEGCREEGGAEDGDGGCRGWLVAPLKLSNRVMEQVEAMAKELGNINQGIWVLVAGIGKLTEVVEGLGKEATKVNKKMKTEDVQKVDKQTEMEEEEDSKEEEESEEEEEKEEKGDDRKEDEEEDEEESDRTKDGKEGEEK